jgi:hypothetical protein
VEEAHILKIQPYQLIQSNMKIKMYSTLERADEKRLGELNNRLGFKIPEVYLNFLIENNGGQPFDNLLRIKGSDGSVKWEFTVNMLYGFDSDLSGDLYHNYFILSDRIPPGLLPIGDDGVGNKICLGVASENYGKVYLWSDTEQDLDEDASTDTVELLTNSLEEFFGALQPA